MVAVGPELLDFPKTLAFERWISEIFRLYIREGSTCEYLIECDYCSD